MKASFLEAHQKKQRSGGKPPKYFPHRTLSSYANKNTKQLRQEPPPPGVEAGLTLEQSSMWKQVRATMQERFGWCAADASEQPRLWP